MKTNRAHKAPIVTGILTILPAPFLGLPVAVGKVGISSSTLPADAVDTGTPVAVSPPTDFVE